MENKAKRLHSFAPMTESFSREWRESRTPIFIVTSLLPLYVSIVSYPLNLGGNGSRHIIILVHCFCPLIGSHPFFLIDPFASAKPRENIGTPQNTLETTVLRCTGFVQEPIAHAFHGCTDNDTKHVSASVSLHCFIYNKPCCTTSWSI